MNKNFANELPPRFRQIVLNMLGEEGEKWMADLPHVIAEIAEKWSLTVKKPFKSLSYNYVAPCISCADGTKAVLKIGLPEENTEFLSEARTLQFLDGNGTVKILNFDESRRVMLLESLFPGENLISMCETDDDRATSIGIELMQKFWRKPPRGFKFKSLENWIKNLDEWEITQFPMEFSKRAKHLFAELNAQSTQNFLLHGDLHHENILSAEREPYLIIDPKGIIGDIGYEIAVFMNDPPDLILEQPDPEDFLINRINRFAEAFQIEPNILNQWAYVQAVLSSWWSFDENDEYWREMLKIAEIRDNLKF